jgi:hypothetical protein
MSQLSKQVMSDLQSTSAHISCIVELTTDPLLF